ncbi:retrovirus-related pol polyprotein from transposon TNT 1-94 [Tanacetum coccineum]
MVCGLPTITSLDKTCEGCMIGKQAKLPFPTGKAKRAEDVLELIHADLCGPMRMESLAGSKYFLLFTDDFSRMSWVYFLKYKLESFDYLKKFKALVEKQSGKNIKILRIDREGVFLSNEFNEFCDEQGIQRQLIAPYSPEQNRVAERKNRTIVEMTRFMLKQKGMPNSFWAEGVATAVYILNISPTKAVWDQTPYEAWIGNKPSVSHLRVFGCICYVLLTGERHKLDGKSQKHVFIDASWNWDEKVVSVNAQDEVFTTTENREMPAPTSTSTSPVQSAPSTPTSSATRSLVSSPTSSGNNTETGQMESMQLHRSERGRIPRHHFQIEGKSSSPQDMSNGDDPDDTFALFSRDPVPVEEVLEREEWKMAMKDELAAIQRNNTWELVDLLAGKHSLGLKWVFKTKYLADGSIEKYKARLVVKGYAQQHGIDYEETFSPVSRFKTIRIILAVAVQWQWKLYEFDVKCAFLNGDLKEEVYVYQPLNFESMSNPSKVFRLHKALYRLKQAPHAWYSKIDDFFLKNGFTRSQHEPTLYVKKQGTDHLLLVSLYVDDMIYPSSSYWVEPNHWANPNLLEILDSYKTVIVS